MKEKIRVIKFRAWDKKNKEMREVLNLELPNKTENERIVAMQFTGLLDKQGKEIYEGDIYRAPHGETGKMEDLVVRYSHASFGLVRYGHDGMNPKRLGNIHNQRTGEVIGNIYENPELLEGDSTK